MASQKYNLTINQFAKVVQLTLDPDFTCDKENFWEKVLVIGANKSVHLSQDKWRIEFSSNPCNKAWRYKSEQQECLTATELINSALVKVLYLSLSCDLESLLHTLVKSNFEESLFTKMKSEKNNQKLPLFYQDLIKEQNSEERFLDNQKYANSDIGIC